MRELMASRQAAIAGAGRTLAQLLDSSACAVKAVKTGESWRAYSDYVGSMVLAGLCKAVVASLEYMQKQVQKPVASHP